MKRTDSGELDVVVGGVRPAPDAVAETSRFIAAMKRRPNYRAELEEAARILEGLGIDPSSYGMEDPDALLDHWRRCVADLTAEGDETTTPTGRAGGRSDVSE